MGQELRLIQNKIKLEQIFQKQIILYGAASGGRNFLSLLKLLGLNAEMFVDGNPDKWNNTVEGIRVFDPDKCTKLMTDSHIIIITSVKCREIKDELLKKGIPETQVFSKAAVELAIHFNLRSSGIADEYIERYYQEFKAYCQIKEHLMQVTDQRVFWECNFDLLWRNPILVYQSGKVGSMSVFKSILEHGKSCVHIHQLMEMGKIYSCSQDWLKQLQNRQIKIITIVRDPVGREVSNFFYGMQNYLSQPHIIRSILDGGDLISGCRKWMQEYSIPGKMLSGLSNVEKVRYDTLYTQKYGSEFDWYDRELKSFTGIDIFAHPFDKEKGYSLLKEGNFEILILKLEKMNSLESVIGEFCGISGFKLSTSNKTEDRAVSLIYEEAKKELEIPQNVLDFYYRENKRMLHFYSEEEVNSFKEKWGRDYENNSNGTNQTE